jgi:hypothetical protein
MKLIFCSTPSRLGAKQEEILDFVTAQGLAPLHPFQAFEFKRYEGGPIGREKTLEFCYRLIDACDEMWMFGISDGTLAELSHALKTRPQIIHLHLEFDPEWRTYYEQLKPKYGDLLSEIPAIA